MKCVSQDVDKLDVAGLDDLCRAYLDKNDYGGCIYEICHVGSSPVCSSFSRADSSNKNRGCAYRDHRHPERPPLAVSKSGSKEKIALAVSADKSVLHLIELLLGVCSKYEDCTYHLENPNGGLQYRPYMVRLLGSPICVDYCSYGHWYQKKTNFWTNVDWSPCGNTGNGRCNNGECKMGPKKSKGRFWHTYALGQCSRRKRGGRGQKARRIMVPGLLHQEMIRSMI